MRLSSIQTEVEAYRQKIRDLEMELQDVGNNVVDAIETLKHNRFLLRDKQTI